MRVVYFAVARSPIGSISFKKPFGNELVLSIVVNPSVVEICLITTIFFKWNGIVVYVCYDVFTDPSPAQVRGRPKYSTYQNFKGRKSNSMMNLHGKTLRSRMYSTDCCYCDVMRCLGHEVFLSWFRWFLFYYYYVYILRFCRFSVGDGVRGTLFWFQVYLFCFFMSDA